MRLIREPSAFVPLLLSLVALAMIVVYVTLFGVGRPAGEGADEGTAARLFQLLMAAQVPIVAWFAIRWLPREPREALAILALQVGAALVPVLTIVVLEGWVSPPTESSPSAAPSAPAVPSGSLPPTSLEAWVSLELIEIADGPLRASAVVGWSGGYVALGQTANLSRVSTVWSSIDGRSWVRLPETTLTPPGATSGAPCGSGVLLVTRSANGETVARSSEDAATWRSTFVAEMVVGGDADLAGDERGALGIVAGSARRLAWTSDCVTWQMVDLPGTGTERVVSIAAGRGTWVAVGDSGTDPPAPVAWWSKDGVQWTRADVEASVDGFAAVYPAHDRFVTRGLGDYGRGSIWTSTDGRTWRKDGVDPAYLSGGESTFVIGADGTRLLGRGSSGFGPEGGPISYWTSLDGISWHPLEVSGPEAVTQNWVARPFLLRDGVLFSLGQSEPTPARLGVAAD